MMNGGPQQPENYGAAESTFFRGNLLEEECWRKLPQSDIITANLTADLITYQPQADLLARRKKLLRYCLPERGNGPAAEMRSGIGRKERRAVDGFDYLGEVMSRFLRSNQAGIR